MNSGTPASRPGSRFLDPRTLLGIRDLRLVARLIVEGFLAGQHKNPRPSVGSEFNQYRPYEPGDDPRRIDWKVYARADRTVVRETRGERDVWIHFLLDATGSMAQADAAPETAMPRAVGSDVAPTVLRKFDTARFLVAALAYLVDRQGDRLLLDAVRDGEVRALGGGRAGRELLDGLDALERLEPSGRWPAWDAPRGVLGGFAGAGRGRGHGRQLFVVVGDLYESSDEMRRALAGLAAMRHEVLVFRILARQELDFAFGGDVVFEELETGRQLAGNADRMRQRSIAALREDDALWRRFALERGMGYEMVVADEPLDRALRDFLLRRRRLPA